jgi:CDP-diacylglycerol--glycerol-3-phosphate 3-phosphatidyltransferase/cardiolipin synthase
MHRIGWSMKRSHEIRLRDALLPPGLLSLARFPLALAFPLAWPKPALAAGVVVAAAVTDVLDGFVARKLHQETETGALLDPLMDKTFVLGVAATLIAARVVTPVEAVLLASREVVELPLVAYVMANRVPGDRRANVAGKLTTVLQFVAVGAVLVHVPPPLRATAIAATAIAGAVAGVTYWARALHDAKGEARKRAAARARRSRAPSRRAARAT